MSRRLPGEITTTTPSGASSGFGSGLHGPELIKSIAAENSFVARASISKPLILRETLKKAIIHQIDNKAFSFIEVLSICPTNWKTDAKESLEKLRQMEEFFKIGEITAGGKNEN